MAMKARDYDNAVNAYRLAISINERDVRAYLLLAEASVLLGQPEDALYFLSLGRKKTNDNHRIRTAYNKQLEEIELSRPPETNGWNGEWEGEWED
jgi:tetratricopeptide (TPR) repeat protein